MAIKDSNKLQAILDEVKEAVVNTVLENLQVLQNPKNGGFYFATSEAFDGIEMPIGGGLTGSVKVSVTRLVDSARLQTMRATRVQSDVAKLDKATLAELRARIAELESQQ